MNNQVTIILFDTDEEYIVNFNEYLREHQSERYLIITFNSIDMFREFYKDYKEIDMIIVAEYCLEELLPEFDKDNIIVLSENKDIIRIYEYSTIYRFQRTNILISGILSVFAERMNINKSISYVKENSSVIIGIYSPVNRCGKSTLTIELAKKLFEDNTLIINLEEFSGIMEYLNIESELNISDLLFFFLKNKGMFDVKLDAVVKKSDKINIIPPVKNQDDLAGINTDIWVDLILKIQGVCEYKVIILDLSNMIKEIFKIFDICRYIFVPYLEDRISEVKIRNFEKSLEKNVDNNIKEKIIKINMSDISDYGYDSVSDKIISKIREINEY